MVSQDGKIASMSDSPCRSALMSDSGGDVCIEDEAGQGDPGIVGEDACIFVSSLRCRVFSRLSGLEWGNTR